MDEKEQEKCAQRLRTALDLADAGITMQRAKFRRENPEASDQDIDRMLGEWLRDRPGAEHGDAIGRAIEFPREES